MKIKESQVTKFTLSEIEGLDTIGVILEDYDPGQGKIIIECYGKSWVSYWGAMGDRTIKQFFLDCDNQYLINRLDPRCEQHVTDWDNLVGHAKKHILAKRHNRDLTAEEAREMMDDLDNMIDASEEEMRNSDIFYEIYGSEGIETPKVTNHKYLYLEKIVDTIKRAWTWEPVGGTSETVIK